MPSSRLQLACIRSRICAWMVTSSAVVGSSAISSSGLHGQRHGDHHALAHAAGELVRVLVDAALGLGDLHQLAASRPRAPSPRARPRPLVQLHASRRSAGRRVSTGLSEVIGSWKIIEIAVAADRAHLASRSARAGRGRGSGSRRRRCGPAARHQAQDRQRGDALAAARLADDAQRLAGVHRERHAVDRAHHAVAGVEGGLQVLDLEQRRLPPQRRCTAVTAASPGADRARRAGRRPAG